MKQKTLTEKEIKSFLMDNAESMQKVLIQEIRDKFVEKVGDKIVWKQGFRVRLQEIKEVEERYKQAIKQFDKRLKEKDLYRALINKYGKPMFYDCGTAELFYLIEKYFNEKIDKIKQEVFGDL